MADPKNLDEILDFLQECIGAENVHVIHTQKDIEAVTLELELRAYLRSGGRLH